MRKFRGRHESPGGPHARSRRRRTGWVLTGSLLAGGLVVGAAGLAGIGPAAGGTDLTSFDMGRLTSIVSSPDAKDEKGSKGAREESKGPKNAPEKGAAPGNEHADEHSKESGEKGYGRGSAEEEHARGKGPDDRGWAYGSEGCERSDQKDGYRDDEWSGKDPKAGSESGKDPKAGPAEKGAEEGGWSDEHGDWDPRCESERERDHRKVVSVPCDSDELIAALVHANATGGGTLELARKCTYNLTAYDKHKSRYEGQAGRNNGQAAEPGETSEPGRAAEPGQAAEPGRAEPSDAVPDQHYAATERSGLPVIYQPIRIKGEGATISRPAQAEEFRFFTVRDGGELELSDVTLENGRAAEGGSIKVDFGGTAVLERTRITKSVAYAPNGGGGAVFSDGHTIISESTFTDNSAAGTAGRGGAVLNGGVLTVEKSEFVENSANGYGGGLANYQGAADISKSTFARNTAAEGGGIASVSARTKVWDSKLNRNTAKIGGGIANRDATLTLRHLKISDNVGLRDGGGISTVKGLLVVDDSLIKANTTFGNGGGVAARESNVIIRKTEITENDASGPHSVGGGIFVEKGSLALFRTRVTENNATDEPGGVFAKQAKVEVDEKTVIIKNRPTNCEGSPEEIPNCFG